MSKLSELSEEVAELGTYVKRQGNAISDLKERELVPVPLSGGKQVSVAKGFEEIYLRVAALEKRVSNESRVELRDGRLHRVSNSVRALYDLHNEHRSELESAFRRIDVLEQQIAEAPGGEIKSTADGLRDELRAIEEGAKNELRAIKDGKMAELEELAREIGDWKRTLEALGRRARQEEGE